MATPITRASKILELIKKKFSREELKERQAPKPNQALPPPIRQTKKSSLAVTDDYWRILADQQQISKEDQAQIADAHTLSILSSFERNIENCIGTIKIPVGIIGPLRVNGIFAQQDYYIPLATTEAALVASYGRGAKLISACGGCTAAILNDGISRTPLFAFNTVTEVGIFVFWMTEAFAEIKKVAESTTRYGQLIDMHTHVEGNHIYLSCEYWTGDAAGQNMATIATHAICQYIIAKSPVAPQYWFLESNFSGDKKASAASFLAVRGKKVTAEVYIPQELITRYLHTDIQTLENYWRISALGGVLSGTIGVQGHFANGLTALYLATGQDVACVSESSVGVTRLEARNQGLYAAVTLPNIIVGTVGGGTNLPSQQAALKILGLHGPGKVHAFAEVCAAVCLAGELSLIGALCADQFSEAHQKLARGSITVDEGKTSS